MSIARYFDPKTVEALRMRQGIVRKTGIVRSVQFKRQFNEWLKVSAASGGLSPLREAYEQSFFQHSNCEWEQRIELGKLVYRPPCLQNLSETLFLLDALKENALKSGLHLFKAEIWKCLDPEQGVEVHQRYLLRKCHAWLIPKWFARWLDSDMVVFEVVFIEQKHVRLEIRHYPARKASCFANIHQLMTAVL